MSAEERAYWDAHWEAARRVPVPSPDPLLFEYTPPLFEDRPHRALDWGCGRGQNAVWLAQQGYTVDATDISRSALAQAREHAARAGGGSINWLPLDADAHPPTPNTYDLAVVMFFLKRDLMSALRACVRPGGRVVYQAHNVYQMNVEPDVYGDYLVEVGELSGYFADWRILLNVRVRGVSQLVAQKPGE